MVSWLHVIWVAPFFVILGFMACALFVGGRLEDVETQLYNQREMRRCQCKVCDQKIRADAAEGDKRALMEQVATARRTNSQLRGMIARLQAKDWSKTP
jgi:hypothetical protein